MNVEQFIAAGRMTTCKPQPNIKHVTAGGNATVGYRGRKKITTKQKN